ncbi:MAG: WG repeat-containing protein [Candidatus Riflebacteria bacterium]|nr:WG repeat-containing protein [Candidatus Riflebacteria bacterium]
MQMRPVFAVILLLTVMQPCYGQKTHITFADKQACFRFEGIDNWEFKPIQVGDKFGFDTGTATGAWGYTAPGGRYVVAPLFDKVCRFMHGYAPVKLNGKWGIINNLAEFVIKPEFEKVWSLQKYNGGSDNSITFFDERGNPDDLYEVDPLEDWTNGFNAGIFPMFKDGSWHLLDQDGKLVTRQVYERILPTSHNRIAVFANNLWGFVGSDGTQVTPMIFNRIERFKEGLAAVRSKNLWGYIDVSGSFVVSEQFDTVKDFASGTAFVTIDERTGIINKEGQYLLKPDYGYIYQIPGSELIKVSKGLKNGIYHCSRGLILPAIYDDCTVNPNGTIVVWNDGKQGLFDVNGTVLLALSDSLITVLDEFLLRIAKEDSVAIFDLRTNELVRTDYKCVNIFHNERAAFQDKSGKWGFLDQQLNRVIPARYTWATDFSWWQAAVEDETGIKIIDLHGNPPEKPLIKLTALYGHPQNWQMATFSDRHGVQDTAGNWCIRPEYQEIRSFSTGVILAKRDSKWVLFTLEENPGVRLTFDQIDNMREGFCRVRAGSKYGFIDEMGRMVIPTQYDMTQEIKNGVVAVYKDNRWGFIDTKGLQVLPHIFTNIIREPDGGYAVYEGDLSGYVTDEGKYMRIEVETLPAESPNQ